jgi:hypothetical protein
VPILRGGTHTYDGNVPTMDCFVWFWFFFFFFFVLAAMASVRSVN